MLFFPLPQGLSVEDYNPVELSVYLFGDGAANIDYKVDVPIDVVVTWSRKWFLGRKTYATEIKSDNPNVQVSKINSVILKK